MQRTSDWVVNTKGDRLTGGNIPRPCQEQPPERVRITPLNICRDIQLATSAAFIGREYHQLITMPSVVRQIDERVNPMQPIFEAANHIAQEIERTRQHLANLEQALEGLRPLISA